MNKLSKKFSIGMIIILAIASLCSLVFNTSFLRPYYLHQKKTDIKQISTEFAALLKQGDIPEEAIEKTEATHKVMIARIENDSFDNDQINEELQSVFWEKGIGFQKYWFWEEDYKKVLKGKSQIRLYQQENLNYSLLINYMQTGTDLYAVTMIVPNTKDAFQIANRFLIAVHLGTIFIAVLFIILLIKRITHPLKLFEKFAEEMKKGRYTPIEVNTKDELESAAKSLNAMGNKVIEYQKSLQEKNVQMEELLDNAAHELKTPVSLIQLYANGIKDGMDDGTFLNTILEENEQMSGMINRLLYLSRIEKKEYTVSEVQLSDLLLKAIQKSAAFAGENQAEFVSFVQEHIIIEGIEELLESLFLNLITNAVKYTSGKEIFIELKRVQEEIIFNIVNETENTGLDIDKIWLPYYVGEESRNKKLSGTGLGLSIVRKICETQHYAIQCLYKENKIRFQVKIPA